MAVASVVLAAARRDPPAFVLGGFVWAGIGVAVTGLAGLALAVANGPPRDPLHILYGLLAVAVVPGAAMIARGRGRPSLALVWAIAGIVFLILVLRLFQTAS